MKYMLDISKYNLLGVDNYIYILSGGFGFLLLVLLFIVIYRYTKNKGSKNKGKEIEDSIDPNIKNVQLERRIRLAIRSSEYQEAIILSFYKFKLICSSKFSIRNARIMSPEELLNSLRGVPNLSLHEINILIKLYRKARFTNDLVNHDEYRKMTTIIKRLELID